MDDHFGTMWGFGLRGMLAQEVELQFPAEVRHWPLLNSFHIEPYEAGPDVQLIVLRDRVPANSVTTVDGLKPWPDNVPKFTFPSRPEHLQPLYAQLREKLNVRAQDALFFVAVTEGSNPEDAWNNHWSSDWQHLLRYQMSLVLTSQLYYVRGFHRVGNFIIPPGYDFLAKQCEAFFADHPTYDRNVFLMTRFDPGNRLLVQLDVELRRVLREHGFDPVRADDKMYMPDRNLWNNVCVYMLCSHQGVAILEDRVANELNPNVALEYGFMRALNKRTLLLADSGFRNLRADIIGTLRETFDITDIEATVEPALERWIAEIAPSP